MEPRPKGLVALDLTCCLPTCLRKKLAGSHGYFLLNTPRKTNAAQGPEGGPTCPPPLSLVCLAGGTRSAAFRAVRPPPGSSVGAARPSEPRLEARPRAAWCLLARTSDPPFMVRQRLVTKQIPAPWWPTRLFTKGHKQASVTEKLLQCP